MPSSEPYITDTLYSQDSYSHWVSQGPARCYVWIGLHLPCRNIGLLFFFTSSLLLSLKPMYDTDLIQTLCTIQSAVFSLYNTIQWPSLYDINLQATTTTILSTRGVMIPIDLVSSATDSIRWRLVLFKPVLIPTSDPKSEFLCQSSLCCAEPTDPLNPPHTPGISPTPSSSRIILIATVPVL